MKKAQVPAAAVVLIVLVLVIASIALTIIILKPSLIIGDNYDYKSEAYNDRQKETIKEKYTQEKEMMCNQPYIKFENNCCLDANYNMICDVHEVPKTTALTTQDIYTTENLCSSPYKKIGSRCCLDDDKDRICDVDERYYDNPDERYDDDADIDSPFSLYDYDIETDEINLELKNKADYTVYITSVEIDDCEELDVDITLEKNDREDFDFDCDKDREFDRDITVTYTKEGSPQVYTADGNIERRDNRYYDKYYDRYDDDY
ncbi:MAG: hypothetical protein AABX16_03420 [Nanoarchaeota archaeon]